MRDARLLVPELSDLAKVLKGFDAPCVEDEVYLQLLRYCRKDSINECFESWRVLAKGGLKRISSVDSWNREELLKFLRKLQKVPCWWPWTGTARALEGAQPLLFARPEDWPDWLPADSLHPQMQKELKQWESDTPLKDETSKIWKKLISERLLRERKDYFQYALLSFVDKWGEERWEKDGWLALGQVLSWSVNRKFESVAPWVEDTDGNQEEKPRAQAGQDAASSDRQGMEDCLRLLRWKILGRASDIRSVLRQRQGPRSRASLSKMAQPYPKRDQQGPVEGPVARRCWVGVSWEPKVRRVSGLPSHRLVAEYKKESVKKCYKWLWDWGN